MTFMYKDYKCEIKMVQEQRLQLKMKFYGVLIWKLLSRGGTNLWWREIKIWLGEATYCRRIFSGAGMNKILAYQWTPILSSWGDGGVSPVGETLIFRLLLFKEATSITRVLSRSEIWHMLFSQSALIPQFVYTSFRNWNTLLWEIRTILENYFEWW